MEDKRRYTRHACNLKVDFEYYEGDPDEIKIQEAVPIKGKGMVLDISRGGVFIVSNSRVPVRLPIKLKFATKNRDYDLEGTIVRTGLVKNNPSEIARRIASLKVKGDSYIAVEFKNLIDEIRDSDL
jgi:hypothetical protein